jgi:hypothetical protein
MRSARVLIWLSTAALLVALHSTGCARSRSVSENDAVKIAAKALMGKPGFDRDVPVNVTRSAERYTVRFQFPVPGGRPGQTYQSFVVVHAESGEVLELGVDGGDQTTSTPRPEAAPATPPTPLREEVDEAGKLQKRLAR